MNAADFVQKQKENKPNKPKIPDEAIIALMRKINDSLGEEALRRLYVALTDADDNLLHELFSAGDVAIHHDGYIGFTSDTSKGWTSECFGGHDEPHKGKCKG